MAPVAAATSVRLIEVGGVDVLRGALVEGLLAVSDRGAVLVGGACGGGEQGEGESEDGLGSVNHR